MYPFLLPYLSSEMEPGCQPSALSFQRRRFVLKSFVVSDVFADDERSTANDSFSES
jgi:hypothetical protein